MAASETLMPLLILNAHDPSAAGCAAEAARRLPPDAPVVALIHGYRYTPRLPGHCASETLFGPGGWPARLALPEGALAIGLCWNAGGSIWQARTAAAEAGGSLARIAAAVGRPVDALAHSLGARVALTAAALAPAGRMGRLILLAAAAFRGEAQAALATPGGAAAEVFNITSRENAIYDRLLAAVVRQKQGLPLGAGLGEWRRNWLDLAIDAASARTALARLGFPIAAPSRRICHWSGYERPGLFPFYRALLAERALLPLALVASMLPETEDTAVESDPAVTAMAPLLR